jgi:hypothetical protein
MDLFRRIEAWRERRYWKRQHMDFLRIMVNDDWRWLGANPIADELTTRYRAALSRDWYQRQHEPVSDFRDRLCKRLGANTFSLGSPAEPPAVEAADEMALMERTAKAYQWGYGYLQDRMNSIGRHGWAHDCDDEITHRIVKGTVLAAVQAAPMVKE